MSKSPALSAGSAGSHPTEAAQTVTQDQAEDLVRLIVARAGLAESPHVEWAAGTGGSVRRSRTGIRLSLGREILDDEEDMRFTIAHELGHIVAGHSELRTAIRTLAWLAVAIPAALLSLIAAGLTLWGTHGRRALVKFAPLLIILINRLLIRRMLQPRELEADDFATQQQCPLTARLAERYQERDRMEKAPGPARLARWAYPTHPSWAARASRQ